MGACGGSVRARGRGFGAADPAAAGDLLGGGRLRPLACAVAAVRAGRRVDAVAVIWAALLARAAGRGWRRVSAAAGRPASTVRGWLSRFAAHAEPIRVGFARLERLASTGMDLDRLIPAGSPAADAVAQIGAACAAVRRTAGVAVFTVSAAEMVAVCSGGWLLGSRPPTVAALSINTCPHL